MRESNTSRKGSGIRLSRQGSFWYNRNQTMSDSRKLAFSDDDKKRHSRLHIAARDLHDAQAIGAFILKKGWKAMPWSRGSAYLQQSAFVTSMIVSYVRAFTKSLGGGIIADWMRAAFTTAEAELHERRHS